MMVPFWCMLMAMWTCVASTVHSQSRGSQIFTKGHFIGIYYDEKILFVQTKLCFLSLLFNCLMRRQKIARFKDVHLHISSDIFFVSHFSLSFYINLPDCWIARAILYLSISQFNCNYSN